jgi:hypothetical protein
MTPMAAACQSLIFQVPASLPCTHCVTLQDGGAAFPDVTAAHLDGVLGEEGEGGQAVVSRHRVACPRRCPAPVPVLAHHITPEQSPVASPGVAVARRALCPTSTRRAPARRVPCTAPPGSDAAPRVTSHPALGLVAPPRSTPHRLTRGEERERRIEQERDVHLDNERDNQRGRGNKKGRKKERKEKIDYQRFTNYIDNYIN